MHRHTVLFSLIVFGFVAAASAQPPELNESALFGSDSQAASFEATTDPPGLPFQRGPRGGRRGNRGGGDNGGDEGDKDKKKDAIKPYDEVITEEAETDTGLFIVHRIGEKLFFEIPPGELETELLWVTQVEKTQSGFGFGGTAVGNRVVRWQKRGETILLRDVKYQLRAEGSDAVRQSVQASSLEPIIKTFPIKAWGKDQAPVIDVTDLFKGDLPEFSAKRRLNASGVDSKRTFIEQIKSFPDNIETKVLMTYKLSAQTDRQQQRGPTPTPRRRRRGARRDPSQGGVTVLLHHSMVKLPAKPMLPRLFDDRVGFFTVSFQDFTGDEHQVDRVRYITRWRLEKKDPEAEVSEPVKPIVYYVGRGVPDKWKPWVKKGIEAWQPAFEAAGFKNAIIGEYAPTKREDPDWDAEDARYSSIRWLPSTTENAMGPHVHDPRTGEILESDIIIYHNVLKLARDWYFTQASPNDERAQKLPLPDDLVGELLAYIVAHEVGHTLGFPHNMKASSSYSIEQLRDAEFTAKNGTEASIMDYGRFNYVAQPGDGARLIPVVGPYDFFAVEWGYRRFDDVKTPDDQKAHLAKIVARQIDDPMLRFGNPNAGEDPSQQTEDLGSDSIAATELGLANLRRVMGYLVKASCDEGKNYDLLRNMYGQVVSQRARELGHVANVVGGVTRQNLRFGDSDRVFYPVSADSQRKAVGFINDNAFQTPKELINLDVLQRLEADGVADRILGGQKRLLRSLISEQRIKRMAENAEMTEEEAYLPVELLADVTKGIWSELATSSIVIDLYRRNLQRAHVELLGKFVKQEAPSSDLPDICRGELRDVLDRIEAGEGKHGDRTTSLHLRGTAARIDALLDPRFAKPTNGAGGSGEVARRGQ